MESVVYDDSPIATYLEGKGEAATASGEASHDLDSSPAESPASFAPSTTSKACALYRKRIPKALKLHARSTSRSISKLQIACSGAVKGQLSQRQNATFLERFRYTIIASDLLSEHNHGHRGHSNEKNPVSPPPDGEISKPTFSTVGIFGIAGAAFILAGSIAWARTFAKQSSLLAVALVVSLLGISITGSGSFIRRKWLQHVRTQVLDDTSAFITAAQSFDTALSAAVTIIQEVELVARGYRISTPLPPVSRLDDQGQQRRCARLRVTAKTAITDLLQPLASAAVSLDMLAVQADLERYHDIYEITRMDMDEVEQISYGSIAEEEDPGSLRSLKLGTRRLFKARKLLLCDLLALDADGTQADYLRWTTVAQTLQKLSSKYMNAAFALDALLTDTERFTVSNAPKVPLTPGRERVRNQIRKLGGLSSGIRGLQAKMHMLREEADHSLDSAEASEDLSAKLLVQYEAIGADLKALLQEWEEGRTALNSSDKKRRSTSSAGPLSPRAVSPTSISGSTAFGGSPSDAFKVLNGEVLPPRLGSISSDEEVFEAVAMPRQRSTLTREERIIKMRDERETRESARQSRQASTNMLRELETVLKHKPQSTSKASRRVTVM